MYVYVNANVFCSLLYKQMFSKNTTLPLFGHLARSIVLAYLNVVMFVWVVKSTHVFMRHFLLCSLLSLNFQPNFSWLSYICVYIKIQNYKQWIQIFWSSYQYIVRYNHIKIKLNYNKYKNCSTKKKYIYI